MFEAPVERGFVAVAGLQMDVRVQHESPHWPERTVLAAAP
jgi:hypothetical protein